MVFEGYDMPGLTIVNGMAAATTAPLVRAIIPPDCMRTVLRTEVLMRFVSAGRLASLVALLLLMGSARTAGAAPLMFLSESAVFDYTTSNVTFTLLLNQAPDLFTVDMFGRQAQSLQYYIFEDEGPVTVPYRYQTIIRFSEIPATGNLIRIRNARPGDPTDPAAGGWGTIRLSVPYTLNGPVLTFTAPLSALINRDAYGFVYLLSAAEYGRTVQSFINHNGYATVPVPVPEPATAALLSLGMLGLFRSRRQRTRSSAGSLDGGSAKSSSDCPIRSARCRSSDRPE